MFGASTFGCSRCPDLCSTRSRIVDGDGPDKAAILAICEAPGEQEDKRGIPLVGQAGKLLRPTMAELGCAAHMIRYTNAVRCWPGKGNRDPTKMELMACSGWLLAEILECEPKVILALGKIAQSALRLIIDQVVESLPNIIVVETWHPSYLLRTPKKRPEWKDDLKRAILLAKVGPFGYQPRVRPEPLPWNDTLNIDWDSPYLAIDTETDDGEEHWSSKIVTWQISDGVNGKLVPEKIGDPWAFRTARTDSSQLKGRRLWFWNAKYDAPILGLDMWKFEEWDDAELGSYVLRMPAGLKDFAYEYEGLPMVPITTLIGTGKKRISFSQAYRTNTAACTEYGIRDAVGTSRAAQRVDGLLKSEPKLERYYREIEKPTLAALLDMEQVGIRVDPDVLQKLKGELDVTLEQRRCELEDEFGLAKPLSTHDLGRVLYRLGVRFTKQTESGAPALDKDQLAIYRGVAESRGNEQVVALIDATLEYRKVKKLKSTYVESLLEKRDHDSRIHARFNQMVAATNRLSSSNPNLQNIPAPGKMGDLGRRIRSAFVARPGYVIVVGDYAQLEMRLFTEYTQEPILLEAFANPENDVHQMLGDEIRLSRSLAKNLFYAILYGAENDKVAATAGATDSESAKAIISAVNAKVPSLLGWRKVIEEQLRAQGFIETLFGWRNYYPLYFSPLKNEISASIREAANFPMQGSAAAIAKIAMRESRGLCLEYGAYTLLQVHDELVFEVPESGAEEFAAKMGQIGRECVTDVVKVPLIFDCQIGRSWSEAKGDH